MFIDIAVFFASIMLLALLEHRMRRKREQQSQLEMEDSSSSPYKRRSTLVNWLVGLLLLSLFVALFVSNVATSNPVVAGVLRSFVAGNLVFVLINWANKAWREGPLLQVLYRDPRGLYD